jgi:hypothetical protein
LCRLVLHAPWADLLERERLKLPTASDAIRHGLFGKLI